VFGDRSLQQQQHLNQGIVAYLYGWRRMILIFSMATPASAQERSSLRSTATQLSSLTAPIWPSVAVAASLSMSAEEAAEATAAAPVHAHTLNPHTHLPGAIMMRLLLVVVPVGSAPLL
jgi:hypothetical protein